MKKNHLITIAVIILLGGIVSYFYWQQAQQKAEPLSVQVPPPVLPPAPKPVIQQVIESPPAQPALPKLAEGDKSMLGGLAGLMDNKSLMLFYTDHIIHNIVAVVDNLPRKSMPINVIPVKLVNGLFITNGSEDNKTISLKNAVRYSAYIRMIEMIDVQKLVDIYVRLYPLFQQAYEELGYPGKYFNDRLLAVIDHLLDAPDPEETVKLVQPHVFYLYADPNLEARSAGQKILMRMGNKNEAKVKAKLREIKQQMMLHMHERKGEGE